MCNIVSVRFDLHEKTVWIPFFHMEKELGVSCVPHMEVVQPIRPLCKHD